MRIKELLFPHISTSRPTNYQHIGPIRHDTVISLNAPKVIITVLRNDLHLTQQTKRYSENPAPVTDGPGCQELPYFFFYLLLPVL